MRVVFLVLVFVFLCGCLEDPVTSEAVSEGDPGLCLALEARRDINDCVGKVAYSEGDASMCDEYIKENDIQLAYCLSRVGGKTGDLGLCDRASEVSGRDLEKWGCYNRVGVETENPEICGRIGDDRERASCYGVLGERMDDVDLCHKAAQARKGDFMADGCFQDLAYKTKDHALCQHVESRTSRDACYLDIAIETDNPEVCLGMSDDYGHLCTGRVTGNPSECDYAGSYKEKCLVYAAETSGEKDICSDLEGYRKDECLTGIVKKTGDASLCSQLEKASKDTCLLYAVQASKTAKPCEKVSESYKDYCITEAAEATHNMSVCDGITDGEERETCRQDVVKSITTTTIAYENKSIMGKAKQKATDKAGDLIMEILGF